MIDPHDYSISVRRGEFEGEICFEARIKELPDILKPSGRIVIISFHSLEDRLVKHAFKNDPRLKVLTKKPIVPSQEEIRKNPRARSAKMRVGERVW